MYFTIKRVAQHLRAEMFRRETAEETKTFLDAIARECRRTGRRKVLVCVSASRPISTVDTQGMGKYFSLAALDPEARVALVADSDELKASQQQVEALARQSGANVRAFDDESAATEWLEAPIPSPRAGAATPL